MVGDSFFVFMVLFFCLGIRYRKVRKIQPNIAIFVEYLFWDRRCALVEEGSCAFFNPLSSALSA